MISLYKFLDVNGARLTLGNGAFRPAPPDTFNDVEDLTVAGVFPNTFEAVSSEISGSLIDVIADNLDRPFRCSEGLRANLERLREGIKINPRLVPIFRKTLKLENPFDPDEMAASADRAVSEVNAMMQNSRVFCVTPRIDSALMWDRYAEGGAGIALRVQPAIQKDSKFQLFRPVSYRDTRPYLYESGKDFIEQVLFQDELERIREKMDLIVYSKTREWEDEGEYRLVIFPGAGEQFSLTIPFHPEEVSELYLGPRITGEVEAEVEVLAKALNPEIEIYRAVQQGEALHFELA
jgi:hypothetical protein